MNFSKIIRIACIIGALFGALMQISCEPAHHDFAGPQEMIVPPEEMVRESSYREVYDTVFKPKCIGCHDGSENRINLSSLSDARNHLSEIRQKAIIGRAMPQPPYAPLTMNELLTLEAWIEAGGPEFPINNNPLPPAPDPLTPTFSSIKENILEVKCMSCHSPGGNAAKVPLDTREELINSPREIVIPGDPEESGLILDLVPDAIKKMPPKDSKITPVSADEIKIIEEWIKNGAN